VYSIGISKNNLYNDSTKVQTDTNNVSVTNTIVQNPVKQTSFKGEAAPAQAPLTLRTTFATNEEQQKYLQIAANLDTENKKNLNLLLNSGILLSTKSNDKSSTLDNLYKMISTPRAQGLNAKNVLSETVNTIANPFVITQNFGNIPTPYETQILQQAKTNPKTPNDTLTKESIAVKNSSDCVSASIEFNLARQMPAEFARFAEGLTSPKMAVEKTIHLKNLTDNTLDSIYLLNAFEIPYQMDNFDKAKLTLAPDKNASVRAQIQNLDKDSSERSIIDVLMQSTFMNVGSQGTYDSLTDIRGGKFNYDNRGLIEFEKTFTESVVQDKNKVSVTYQTLDDNGNVNGHTKDFNTITKNILDSLKMKENVIIGYTYTVKNSDLPVPNPDKKSDDDILLGHEITIIGAVQDKNGNLIFICNDTDDNNPNPIAYPASYIIPKIHHAGLPQKVVENDSPTIEPWKEGLKSYEEAKSQSEKQNQPQPS
jgi:hypothetical protein